MHRHISLIYKIKGVGASIVETQRNVCDDSPLRIRTDGIAQLIVKKQKNVSFCQTVTGVACQRYF